jgi:glycosyltransferase involved in cell wall biosynthesis
MTGTISFIVPTIGRASLADTLASIETDPGDEILVVGDCFRHPPTDPRPRYIPCMAGEDWGCKERTLGIGLARGDYLAFIDDDDVYRTGARAAMREAMRETPDRPVLFRMTYPDGRILWHYPLLRCGNVSTQMVLIPNDPARLGRWTARREGDFDFLASMQWPPDEIAWRYEVIACLGR